MKPHHKTAADRENLDAIADHVVGETARRKEGRRQAPSPDQQFATAMANNERKETTMTEQSTDLTFVTENPVSTGKPRSMASLAGKGAVQLAPELLKQRDKERWAVDGVEFTIYAIRPVREPLLDAEGDQVLDKKTGELKFDEYWSHLVESRGKRYSFRLSPHPARNGTATDLMRELKTSPISGMRLFTPDIEAASNRSVFLLLGPVGPDEEDGDNESF